MPTRVIETPSLSTQREQLQRIANLELEVRDLKNALHATQINAAFWERENRITNAGISQAAKERLHRAFEGHISNAGLREAINTEKRQVCRV
jgi:hypothetical protein